MKRLVAAAALAAAAAASPAVAAGGDSDADEPTAVPYRPSVSAPAALSAPGWLEIEAGLQHDHAAGGARRDSLPYTAKLAFTPDWGVRIGGEAWARQRVPGRRDSGFGDLGFVVKRRFAVDDDQAFGVEAGAVYPTGGRRVHSGSGKPDYAAAGIYSADAGTWHVDLNLVANRLGQPDAGAARLEALYAVAVSHPITEALGVVAEVSGTRQRGAESTRQLLVAASCNVSKRLVFDAGAARSLRGGSAEWSAFAGLTWTAARIFGAAP